MNERNTQNNSLGKLGKLESDLNLFQCSNIINIEKEVV